ncbi:MAG: hypothetical protein J6Z01_16700 [Bacteroidales bacterium]|nr:hypothetical protein [Bacteroidales bacterium]
MKIQHLHIISLLSMLSCQGIEQSDSINIIGNPDSSIFNQYISNKSVCSYVFNDMIECSIVVNDSGPYHCFIKEDVLGEKQIYYFCIDDVLKYNYIPEYDSLNYDLSLTYKDTEYELTKWSTKFEKVPLMRKKSEEYHKLVNTLDDDKDLSDFYNNSLFFQSDIISVDYETKKTILYKLIEMTQVQLVGKYLRSVPNYENAIVLGWRYGCYSYNIQYWTIKDFYALKSYLNELGDNLDLYIFKRLRSQQSEAFKIWYDQYQFTFSKYLQSIQQQNLNYMTKLFEDTDSLYEQYDFCITVDYRFSDTRFFFFKIDWLENNKITIHKNYINKEFLPTTRISNYYLYY